MQKEQHSKKPAQGNGHDDLIDSHEFLSSGFVLSLVCMIVGIPGFMVHIMKE